MMVMVMIMGGLSCIRGLQGCLWSWRTARDEDAQGNERDGQRACDCCEDHNSDDEENGDRDENGDHLRMLTVMVMTFLMTTT